jgi:hypothetical protein
MNRNGARWRRAALVAVTALLLGACAGRGMQFGRGDDTGGADSGIHAYPDNYKADILAAMHAYLNDPTGIRDASISEPMLKEVGNGMGTRYVVCLRFNGKRDNGNYAGIKQIEAVFLAGRFDDFVDAPREPCLAASYAPFPELEQIKQ